MRPCTIGVGEARGLLRDGTGHAGGLEHALAHEDFPRLPGDFLDELAGDGVQHVVVGVTAAEAGRGLDMAQRAHGVGAAARRGRDEHQVARAQAQAAAVHEQVAHGHLVGHPCVVHAEPRDVVDDLVVPLDLAVVDQHRERGGGDRLAGRSGRKDGVGVHALGRTELAHAVAFREHGLAVLHDRDRQPRHAVRLHGGLHARVEVGRLRGECGPGGQQQGQGEERRSDHGMIFLKVQGYGAASGCARVPTQAPHAHGQQRQRVNDQLASAHTDGYWTAPVGASRRIFQRPMVSTGTINNAMKAYVSRP